MPIQWKIKEVSNMNLYNILLNFTHCCHAYGELKAKIYLINS